MIDNTCLPSPETVVQTQLDAYNARDLDAFLATYAAEAEILGFPATLHNKGHDAMRNRYALRFADTQLHAKLVKRIVMGTTVIDHELVQVTLPEGLGTMEVIVIYEIENGKIARSTLIAGPKVIGGTLAAALQGAA